MNAHDIKVYTTRIDRVRSDLKMLDKIIDLKEAELEVLEKHGDDTSVKEEWFESDKLKREILKDVLKLYEEKMGNGILSRSKKTRIKIKNPTIKDQRECEHEWTHGNEPWCVLCGLKKEDLERIKE